MRVLASVFVFDSGVGGCLSDCVMSEFMIILLFVLDFVEYTSLS